MRNNLNSFITIESISENQFKHAFIYYDINAIRIIHCRSLLELDDTHLKIRYQDIFLIVIDIDAHEQFFSLV